MDLNLRLLALIPCAALLVACGGSSPDQSGGPKVTIPPVVGPGDVVVAARNFATDTRTADQDGIDGLDPILSSAPPDCYFGPANTGSLPDCLDAINTPETYYGVSDTWVDAQVYVPEHRPGETFPVVLQSHGWGGSKLASLSNPGNDCIDDNGNYDYDCNDLGSGIFGKTDTLVAEFAHNDYIVVSFSERGWGNTEGDIMVMNPYHETFDAIAVLDWIERQAGAGELPVKRDSADDMVVGTIGGSYGGGFQFPLATIDPRVDAMIPVGTWHSLHQSILPNDVVKGGFGNLLCALATGRSQHDVLVEACSSMKVATSRSTFDPQGTIVQFMDMNGMDYLVGLEEDNEPFRSGEAALQVRPLNALLIQGTRDVLFPLQEAANNYETLSAAGGDVRIASTEGGHMNPVAGFGETSNRCGNTDPWNSARRWFDHFLRGAPASVLDPITEVCLSLDDDHGVILNNMPGKDATFDASIGISSTPLDFSVTTSTFQQTVCSPVHTVPDDGETYVLAGVPQITEMTVDGGLAGTNISYLGLCVTRGGDDILVDEMMTGYPAGAHSNIDMVAVGELLQAGDQVGIIGFSAHPQFAITTLDPNQPSTNVTSATGKILLPIFPISANAQLSTYAP